MQVAIDGPSGVGKSTIARALARHFGIVYIDTGAMYRAVGLKAAQMGVNIADEGALEAMLLGTAIGFTHVDGVQHVLLDGRDVESEIRTPEASRRASEVSQSAAVRRALVRQQQEIARQGQVVMDGRDIGTHVLPNARHKFFLTASPEVRAQRRFDELTAKGEKVSFEQVLRDQAERDARDTTRAVSPLRPADDAVIIDTDTLSIDDELALILSYMEGTR
jgi:cytidylate kinase